MTRPPIVCGADRFECQTLEEMERHMQREHGVGDAPAMSDHIDVDAKNNWFYNLIEEVYPTEPGMLNIGLLNRRIEEHIASQRKEAELAASIAQTKRIRNLVRQEGRGSWQRVIGSELTALQAQANISKKG